MQKKLRFLKVSSLILKIVAWIFLFAGIITGSSVILGRVLDYPRWIGIPIILFYSFSFLFLYTVAIMADILVEIRKEE
jgi:hypothetical protein